MTKQEAIKNIGKPFKLNGLRGGIGDKFDIIRRVDESGNVYGDFLEAHHEYCRLKQEQPTHLNNNQ